MYEKGSWEYFYIAKRNRGQKQAISHDNTNSVETKDIFFTSRATSFMTKRQSLKTTGVNITEDVFKTGDDIRRISSTSIQSMFIQFKTQFNNAFPSTTTLVNSFFLSDFKMKI